MAAQVSSLLERRRCTDQVGEGGLAAAGVYYSLQLELVALLALGKVP